MADDASEWITLLTDVSVASFSLTLCTFHPEVRIANITATRPRGATEAAASWKYGENKYYTEAIRAQLGVTERILPFADRGIFELAKKDSWLIPPYPLAPESFIESLDMDSILRAAMSGLPSGAKYPDYNNSDVFPACIFCDVPGPSMSRLHAAVFQDTIQDTGSAAWAIQALITSLFSMSYYDHIFQFDVAAPADLVTELVVTRPTSRRFFTAVLAMVVLHLVLVAVMTALFVRRADDGILGGSWAAVARVSGPATDGWLAVASTATDAEVSRGVDNAGQKHVLVGLERFGEQVRLRQRMDVRSMAADG
jgi:hypothetical protein